MTPLRRSMLAAAVLTVGLGACSGTATDTTTSEVDAAPTTSSTTTATPGTTVVSGDVVFGSGVLPDAVPSDFSIPNGAVIDSTLVNTVTGFTEAALMVPAQSDIVALFFDQNLEARSYDFDPAEPAGDGRWLIRFSKDGVSGSVDVVQVSAGVTRATITLTGAG